MAPKAGIPVRGVQFSVTKSDWSPVNADYVGGEILLLAGTERAGSTEPSGATESGDYARRSLIQGVSGRGFNSRRLHFPGRWRHSPAACFCLVGRGRWPNRPSASPERVPAPSRSRRTAQRQLAGGTARWQPGGPSRAQRSPSPLKPGHSTLVAIDAQRRPRVLQPMEDRLRLHPLAA